MANSFTEIQVTGVDSYTFAIPYLSQDHIKVFVGGTLQTLNTHYTFTNTYTIEFTAGNIPADTSEYIVIKRDTSTDARLVTYSNTGLDADDLNRDSDQVFYMAQEAVDAVEGAMIQDESLNFDAQGKRIVNAADPVGPQDVATSKYVAEQIAGAQGAVTVSETAPTDNTKGDLWIDSSDNIMHVWTGYEWVNGGVQETARFDFLGSDASAVVDGRAIFPQSLHDLDSASITQLYLNGVLLKPTTAALDFTTGDYDLFDGAGISIKPAPVGSDEITVIKSATISSVLLDEIDNLKNSAALITTAAHGGKSVKESFTATAGQTVINLANTYVQNINNVSVYVNGVRQADYSESTTTSITLTNPLSLGDEIVVIINEYAVNQNGLDMNLVTYTPEGTGAVERTLGSKLGETVSVKDFGAKGDGVTDDTAAIQAAITSVEALGRGELTIPVGEYRLSAQISISDCDISIKGSGTDVTNLVWSNSDGGIAFNDNTGISAEDRSTFTLKDLTLSTTNLSGGTALSFDYSLTGTGAPFGDASTVKIRDVDIRGLDFYGANTAYWTTGINLLDAGGVHISDTRLLGSGSAAGTSGIIIKSVNRSVLRAMFEGIQIEFVDKAFHIIGSIGNTVEGVYLTNYEFVACNIGVIVTGGVVHALELSNGHIDATQSCLYIQDSASRGSSTIKLVNNYLQIGDKWNGSYSTGNVIELDRVDHFSLIGNYLLGDPSKSVQQNGVLLESCDYGTVSSNQFNSFVTGIIFSDNGANGACVGSKAASSNTYRNCTNESFISGVGSTIAKTSVSAYSADSNDVSGLQIRTGAVIATLDAAGSATIPYSSSFSTGTISGLVSNNDSTAASGVFNVTNAGNNSASLTFNVVPNPGAISVNITYIAIGY